MTVYNPDEDAIKLEQSIYFLIYKRPSKTKSFDPDVRKKMFDEEDESAKLCFPSPYQINLLGWDEERVRQDTGELCPRLVSQRCSQWA